MIPKRILKSLLLVFAVHFLILIWIYLSEGEDIYIGILIGILGGMMLSFIVVGWCYTAFLLIDSEKWYYQLFAVIMNGLFGIVILLGLRWIYRKLGFTFLD